MKQTIEIEVDIPEGYEFDRYDHARPGETYTNGCDALRTWDGFDRTTARYVIVRKKPKRYRVFEETGEVRHPKPGEFVDFHGEVRHWEACRCAELPILREVTDQVTVTERGE